MKIKSICTLGHPATMGSWALVEVACEGGLSGIGMTGAPAAAVQALISCPTTGMARLLVGQDAREVNRLTRLLDENWQAERGRGDEGGLAANAAAAVEQALWDLLGKATGLPLHQLLGGARTRRVRVYASASAFNEQAYENDRRRVRRTTEELVAMARKFKSDGYRAFKFGWGNHYSEDALETIRTVRQAVGPDIGFMLDFGCPAYFDEGWTVKEAIRVSHLLAEAGIDFWEEPLRPGDAEGYARLTAASPVAIATGESLTRFEEFRRLIDARAVDIVQPDVIQLGVSVFLRVAQAARAAGLECVPHGPWGAPAVAGHVQMLACISPDTQVEYPSHFSHPSGSRRDVFLDYMHNRLFSQPLRIEQGHVILPDTPGLGLGDWVHAEIPKFEAFLKQS